MLLGMWLQTLLLVMCLDLSKFLTLLSLSMLICQMGTTAPLSVGLLGGLALLCSKAQSSLKICICLAHGCVPSTSNKHGTQ